MKIVVGGQLEKNKIAELASSLVGDKATVEVMGDVEAAMALKSGQVDFYLGACNTGGGGALAMVIAIAGADKCVTVGMPGKLLSDEEIIQQVKNGKKAFGFTAQDIDRVVPVIISALGL